MSVILEKVKNKVKRKCPLCVMEKLTPWLYEDEKIVICRCKSHPDKWMIVLRRHTAEPSFQERQYMKAFAEKLLPDCMWRNPRSIKDHYHLHEEEAKSIRHLHV